MKIQEQMGNSKCNRARLKPDCPARSCQAFDKMKLLQERQQGRTQETERGGGNGTGRTQTVHLCCPQVRCVPGKIKRYDRRIWMLGNQESPCPSLLPCFFQFPFLIKKNIWLFHFSEERKAKRPQVLLRSRGVPRQAGGGWSGREWELCWRAA